jgi:hypothetical protein
MSINNASVPFTSSLVSASPEAAGVFALWQAGGIVYYGKAATIRAALGQHLEARAYNSERVSGCSWEVASDPESRYVELLREYELAHRCIPLWNDPRRLPTG